MRIAALCAYFADSLAPHVAGRLLEDGVDVHLWALEPPPVALLPWTRGVGLADKFVAFNRLLPSCRGADLVLFVDDDVRLPPRFAPTFAGIVQAVGADLAQPAQTENSACTFKHVLVDRAVRARQVNWVECGPVFAMTRRFLDLATPFPEAPLMGWGLDHLWAGLLRQHGLRAAIVDACPVEHAYRAQASRYSARRALRSMRRFLRARDVSPVEPVAVPLAVPGEPGDAVAMRGPRGALSGLGARPAEPGGPRVGSAEAPVNRAGGAEPIRPDATGRW